ncbi:MAG TPA: peptidoglycan editing factor PgeF [Alphaproteobacteria bacterium]|nr:peptidoglycan editing factor PgeF [Alphaproteobacteria bacterium]
MIASETLTAPGLSAAFFTREGGVSDGLYAALNCGYGSGDDPEAVRENRRRATARLGVKPEALVTLYQVHSPSVVVVDEPWRPGQAPKADGAVTLRRGMALGILTADCAPVLFADIEAGVIGAAHAGWRGAFDGVLEETVAAMQRLGASPRDIRAAIGPCIAQASYEVGPEFHQRFLAADRSNATLFRPAVRTGHYLFDLAGYVRRRLERLRLAQILSAGGDTAAEPERYFSYRRATLSGEKDYGRLLSAITLED